MKVFHVHEITPKLYKEVTGRDAEEDMALYYAWAGLQYSKNNNDLLKQLLAKLTPQ